MRIGCLQFAPQVGDVDNNLNRADSVLSKANPEDLDVLVLPELAFSGYNFKSLQDITPFLEHSGSGITSLWARTVALKYNCYVTVGYPEKVDVSPMWPTGPEYYNSAIVVNGDGETVANYRKCFLYYTDETWALEGNKGFFDGYLPGLGNTSIGICMDLNPYKFEAPWHAFEFAFHVLEVESNIVIVSMAWMTREDPRRFSRMPNEPDMDTLTYWVTRLEPIIRSDNQEELIVVFCNRTGNEDEATYAGTSAVIGIQDGEVKVYGLLGRGEKELLIVDTNDAPYAKLVYRPDVGDSDRKSVSLDKIIVPQASDANGSDRPTDTNPAESKSEKDKNSERRSEGGDSSSVKKQDRSTRSKSRDRSRSRGRSPGKQSPPPGRETAPLPPLPTLPDSLAKELKESMPKRRLPASISIPPPPGLTSQGGSATPGTDSFDIPTPSAPSPTPMAIRPKLIIPASPTGKIYQYPSDYPVSALSERSERSIQSVRSDESEASVQTVKSNPRPPEDSTPYPHSGAPLSGYPTRTKIYGGHVTISHMEEFTPTTPFDDMSPTSPRWFWKPSDNLLKTPVNGGAWQPGTPIGRKPEPFPWQAIKPPSRNKSRNGMRQTPKNDVKQQEMRQVNSQSPQSNTSSNRTTKRPMSASGGNYSSSNGDHALARPPSPKSRNASRSRLNDRSNSSLSQHEVAAAVNQHLEFISLRAESANKMRTESAANTPIPASKSRNCSRSRPSDAAELQSGQQTIQIAASPSLLNGEGGEPSLAPAEGGNTPQRPMSRLGHQRSNSFTSLNDKTFTPSTSSNILRQTVRAASRGRQPGPKISPTHSDPTTSRRAPSVDTVMAEAYYSQFRNSSSQSHNHRRPGRRPSNGAGSRSRQNPVDLTEFERFEAIICPNCPVHGRVASTSNANDATPPTYPDPIPSSLSHRHHQVDAATPAPENAQNRKTPSPKAAETSPKPTTSGVSNKEYITSSDSISEPDLSSGSAQTASTRPRSTPTLVPFNPTTPKAMAFSPADLESLPLPTGEALSPTRCAETEPVQSVDLPRSTVA